MIDQRLRVVKDRIVAPFVARLPSAITPGRLTLASLAWPAGAQAVCWVMAALVAATVMQRLVWAGKALR